MLACTSIDGASVAPGRVVWLLHGILGSGRNWRAFARRMVERCPSWRVVLVDLRGHGDSHGTKPPHTLDAAVDDLEALAFHRGEPPALVVGHSFGGKVAMTWATRANASPRGFWALDATPWAIEADGIADDVVRVITQVRSMRPPFASHEQIRGAFLQAGFSEMLAGWMTTNVERASDGLRWRFDLEVVDALLRDYARTDLMERLRRGAAKVDIVRAGRSDRWDSARLEELENIASTSEGRVSIHLLPEAGHWVHVDDPEGTLRLLVTALERMDHDVIDS